MSNVKQNIIEELNWNVFFLVIRKNNIIINLDSIQSSIIQPSKNEENNLKLDDYAPNQIKCLRIPTELYLLIDEKISFTKFSKLGIASVCEKTINGIDMCFVDEVLIHRILGTYKNQLGDLYTIYVEHATVDINETFTNLSKS